MLTSAFNYHETAWNTNNISGLQKSIGIHLGLRDFRTRPLTSAFADSGLDLVSEESADQSHGSAEGLDLVGNQAGIRQRFREVPLEPAVEQPAGDNGPKGTDKLFDEIIYLKNKVVSGSILANGIHLDRYRVEIPDNQGTSQLIYRPAEGDQWRLLASYSSEEEAITAANKLRRFLVGLNVASEGLHILEHILLTPKAQESHDGIKVPEDFYSFKLSVLFPTWTARFNDPSFRRVAEETVQLNCPAHVHPEVHWLEFEKMKQFEELYKSWLDLKCDESSSPEQIDGASKQLISFILGTETQGLDREGEQP